MALAAVCQRYGSSRSRGVACRDQGGVDSAFRSELSSGHGWNKPHPGRADRFSGDSIGGMFLDGNPEACRVLLLQPPMDSGRGDWRIPCAGSVSVFLLLGADAGADVFPDWDLGT